MFLKNRKFPAKNIITGQKRGWCFARKDTPPNSIGVDTCKKVHLSLGGGGINLSNKVRIKMILQN